MFIKFEIKPLDKSDPEGDCFIVPEDVSAVVEEFDTTSIYMKAGHSHSVKGSAEEVVKKLAPRDDELSWTPPPKYQ